MSFTERQSLYVGSHLWFVPEGEAFTIAAPGTVAQNGAANWPGAADPKWADWLLGVVEDAQFDPKPANKEVILAPSPGRVKGKRVIVPYAIPEVEFTLLEIPSLAVQIALNTEKLFGTTDVVREFSPNGGTPGMHGILKAQHYGQGDELLWQFASWCYIEMKGPLKQAPKSMTKPQFLATLLDSDNNDGSLDD